MRLGKQKYTWDRGLLTVQKSEREEERWITFTPHPPAASLASFLLPPLAFSSPPLLITQKCPINGRFPQLIEDSSCPLVML